MTESWRPVVGYEGIYEVSDHGRVRRVLPSRGARAGHTLTPTQAGPGYITGKGYPSVCIYKDRKVVRRTVHRLVAEAFLGPRPERAQINHKDSDKSNNHVDNLEYVTPSENFWHAVEAGNVAGVTPPKRRLNHEIVAEIRRRARTEPQKALAADFGLDTGYVSRIVRHKVWKEIP